YGKTDWQSSDDLRIRPEGRRVRRINTAEHSVMDERTERNRDEPCRPGGCGDASIIHDRSCPFEGLTSTQAGASERFESLPGLREEAKLPVHANIVPCAILLDDFAVAQCEPVDVQRLEVLARS